MATLILFEVVKMSSISLVQVYDIIQNNDLVGSLLHYMKWFTVCLRWSKFHLDFLSVKILKISMKLEKKKSGCH